MRESCFAALTAFLLITTCDAPFAQSPVTWLIFVDDLHLEFRNTGRIRDALKTIVRELVQDGDEVAIASSGPSSLALGPTKEREEVALEIRKATGNALKYGDMLQPYGAAEVFYRASISITNVRSCLAKASLAESGVKAMLYISNGFSFDALPDPAPQAVGRMRVPTRSEIVEQLAQLTAAATQAGVRIFAIDTRAAAVDLDDPFAQPGDPGWQAHLLARQALLRSISEETAGFAIIEGDFVTQLRRIAEMVRK